MYYRDPCAEDKGIMDGVIDLNTVTAVTPLQVARNYGFQTVVSVYDYGIGSFFCFSENSCARQSTVHDVLKSRLCRSLHRVLIAFTYDV